MKSPLQSAAVWVSTVLLLALQSFPTLGGARTYDLNLLLNKPHPFAEAPSSYARTNARLQPLRSNDESKPSIKPVLNSFTVFGGVMTNNAWQDIFTPGEIEFRETVLFGFAVSRRIWDFHGKLSMEIEGQIVRHFGDQDNWEFNLPLVVRWHVFPWDKWLDTSLALGAGPSYASEIPKEEIAQDGNSQQGLVYAFGELEFGLQSSLWSGIFRLHHRSGGFGIVADRGGSNVLAIGLRRRF